MTSCCLLCSRLTIGFIFPQELRRGADSASIHSLALSRNCEWLAVSSDKGTVHVFALSENVATQSEEAQATNGSSADAGTYDSDGKAASSGNTNGGGTSPAAASRHNTTSMFKIVKVGSTNTEQQSTRS